MKCLKHQLSILCIGLSSIYDKQRTVSNTGMYIVTIFNLLFSWIIVLQQHSAFAILIYLCVCVVGKTDFECGFNNVIN